MSTSAEHPTAGPKAFATEKPPPAELNGVGGEVGGGNETGRAGGNGAAAAAAAAGEGAGAEIGGGGDGGRSGASVAYQPTGGAVLEFHNYEVKPDDVLVEQGRHAVSVQEMLMRPVFWPFSGQGDEVCRSVWMRDTGARPYPRPRKRRGTSGAAAAAAATTTTGGVGKDAQEDHEDGETDVDEDYHEGPVGLEPYPLRAAAILEDAYRFLAWYLECREGGGPPPGARSSGEVGDKGARGKPGGGGSLSPTVLLTVQVADELVQFRSLTDIVSVKRNLGSAFSLFGRRRVFRGVPVEEEGGIEEGGGRDEGEREKREEDGTGTGRNDDDDDAPPYPDPPTSSGTPYASESSLDASEDQAVTGSSTESEQSPSSGPTHASGSASGEGDGGEGTRVQRNPSSSCSSQYGCRAEGADKVDSDLEERVEHLVLVVHGIGDALMSVDLGMVQLRSLVECCDTMRAHHEEVVLNSKDLRGLRKKKGIRKRGRVGGSEDFGGGGGGRGGDGRGAATAEETQEEEEEERDCLGEVPTGLGRVEYLPVEWHTRFKGRLYREGGGSGGAAEGSSKDHPGTSPPSGATRRPRSEGAPGPGRGEGSGATGAGGSGSGIGSGGLSIWDITLPRAPTLRAFTNDTLLDILYFMSPEYHQVIVQEVTQEINRILELFRKHTRDWSGKVSIVAHSLGAIICFDIMANQPSAGGGGGVPPGPGDTRASAPSATPVPVPRNGGSNRNTTTTTNDSNNDNNNNDNHSSSSSSSSADGQGSPNDVDVGSLEQGRRPGEKEGVGVGGKTPQEQGQEQEGEEGCLRYYRGSTKFPELSARVENVFCLGSPIGMFLMIRGQHRRLGKAFKLPGCRRLFNIFHPYDPVAFRLEPLLRAGNGDVQGANDGGDPPPEEPVILPTWTGGLRVHYQVQRWWQDIWSRACETKRRAEVGIERSLESIGLIDEQTGDQDDNESSGPPESPFSPSSSPQFATLSREGHARGGGFDSAAAAPTAAGGDGTMATLAATGVGGVTRLTVRETASTAASQASLNSLAGIPGERQQQQQQQQKEEQEQLPEEGHRHSRPGNGAATTGTAERRAARAAWQSAVMEEDLERNGALAGGRRVDYCLQEKEFEVTNEYIFALGSHVIYWSSKDVSLFVAQQVVADATAASDTDARAPATAPSAAGKANQQ
ncbi:DDHD domain-containing protein [Ectocarpus siliculosus]|uniref:DDHD domain-containing protein n=1 Tax=Ectocarpus siliculosus TaxID=2880 RepID=D8LDT5_ECTSI|nr:DDHD domain-containing protein [Ectocarpus siliculosus]|eukprot:CBN78492.1 DDHD domain-containing protein [Ectocarpus siliculosus]